LFSVPSPSPSFLFTVVSPFFLQYIFLFLVLCFVFPLPFFFFLLLLLLYSGPHACRHTLYHLSPSAIHQPCLCWVFLRWGLRNYLPVPVLNWEPPDLCLLSSQDYSVNHWHLVSLLFILLKSQTRLSPHQKSSHLKHSTSLYICSYHVSMFHFLIWNYIFLYTHCLSTRIVSSMSVGTLSCSWLYPHYLDQYLACKGCSKTLKWTWIWYLIRMLLVLSRSKDQVFTS
jgi:hypothetical protein